MVKSAYGWELPKFRTQNGTSFNFTGLILKWAGMNLKYIQLPFTIFNFRSYVEQPSLFMTKLKVEEKELMNLIFKNLIH